MEIGVIVDYSIPDFEAYSFLHAQVSNARGLFQTTINLPLTFKEGLCPKTRRKQKGAKITYTILKLCDVGIHARDI